METEYVSETLAQHSHGWSTKNILEHSFAVKTWKLTSSFHIYTYNSEVDTWTQYKVFWLHSDYDRKRFDLFGGIQLLSCRTHTEKCGQNTYVTSVYFILWKVHMRCLNITWIWKLLTTVHTPRHYTCRNTVSTKSYMDVLKLHYRSDVGHLLPQPSLVSCYLSGLLKRICLLSQEHAVSFICCCI
jgi:hypothetical protein